MNFFGREIKPEVATMWVNIIGFIASMIFYCTVETGLVTPVQENPLQSELVKVDTKLNEEIKQLRQQQDSLLKVIQSHEARLEQTQSQVKKQKAKIFTTIHSDWDTLTQQQREDYTNQLLVKLKNKKP